MIVIVLMCPEKGVLNLRFETFLITQIRFIQYEHSEAEGDNWAIAGLTIGMVVIGW